MSRSVHCIIILWYKVNLQEILVFTSKVNCNLKLLYLINISNCNENGVILIFQYLI